MKRLGLAIAGSVLVLGAASAGEPYGRAGWNAQIANGLHDVELTATIIDEYTILVEHFTYDGTAPLVYFYLAGNDTFGAFLVGLEVPPVLDRAYSDESLLLTLPLGETLNDYTGLSVWCALFDVNFGSAVFKLDESADVDDDGDVDLEDNRSLADCMNGPNAAPTPSGLSVQQCLDAFDGDSDGDVDATDYQSIQAAFTGPPASAAEYELVFDATWSEGTHPQDFPTSPHFSGLVGGTHNDTAVFWEMGGLASQGIKDMAELGNKTALISEVDAEIDLGNAGEVISGGNISPSPGSRSVTFTVTQDFLRATVTSMVAPSPDWFVGVSGYALFRDNQWTPQIVIPLEPYDAGTDSGLTFVTPNLVTDPPDPIQIISGFPFLNGLDQSPLGTFTFRRID